MPEEGAVASEPFDYLHEFGNTPSALLYSTLFVPSFVEVDGSVLIETVREDAFLESKKTGNMSLADLEASFNFIEVPYLFSNRDGLDSDDDALAQLIAEAWRARLKHLFPDRRFLVFVLSPTKTGSVVAVQFHEVR